MMNACWQGPAPFGFRSVRFDENHLNDPRLNRSMSRMEGRRLRG